MNSLAVFPLELEAALLPDEALRRILHSGGARPFLLDGAANADGLGRFSYAGCEPKERFVVEEVPAWTDHALLSRFQKESKKPQPVPVWQALADAVTRFAPLVSVGLLDYELGRASERLPSHAAPHGLFTAAVDFAAYDAIYRYDSDEDRGDILATDAQAAARLRARLCEKAPPVPPLYCGPLHSETDAQEYGRRVRIVLEHLRAGDCYQVNLCRRLRAKLPQKSILAAYLSLRKVAPAPLGCYLALESEDATPGPVILGNSPELLLKLDWKTRSAETRPIKGTRRRGKTEAEDRALREELLASEKDRAEHIMIVDLLRNDLGRIAEIGSVEVSGLLRCVELPTVHHLVSTIRARPEKDIGLAELLHALVPGGSITGAPKVAAMKLIDALEPQRRGPFYGAVGWLGPSGGELALCIRTGVAVNDELVLSVGGGLVLDSTPEDEWLETEAKATAFARALA